MDVPGSEDIVSAAGLRLRGAVPDNKLTELGRKMAGYALHPRLTAAILAGAEIGCAEEVLTIIALVNGESIFVTYSTDKDENCLGQWDGSILSSNV